MFLWAVINLLEHMQRTIEVDTLGGLSSCPGTNVAVTFPGPFGFQEWQF